MRFEEIKAYREHKIININLIEKEKINIKIENLISFLKVGEKYYIKDIRDEKSEYFQINIKINDEAFIDELIDKRKTYLAALVDISSIEVIIYNNSEINGNNFSIHIGEYLKNRKNKIPEKEIEKNYVFKSQGMSHVLLGKLKASENENKDGKYEYSLLGVKSILLLERKEFSFIQEDKTKFIEAFSVVKEERINNSSEKYNYTLVKIKGNIKFTEDIINYMEDIEIQARLNELKNDPSSFLKIWEDYANIEKKFQEGN